MSPSTLQTYAPPAVGPNQQDTDHVRRALRNLCDESPALVGRTHRAQQSCWYCTPAGLTEAAACGELVLKAGRTNRKRFAASKTLSGTRPRGADAVVAFHQAEVADCADWQVDVTHPTPAGSLVPDGVVLLNNGSSAFVEIDRMMSYARLVAKLKRSDAYPNEPASGRRNAARIPFDLLGVPLYVLASHLCYFLWNLRLPASRCPRSRGSFSTGPTSIARHVVVLAGEAACHQISACHGPRPVPGIIVDFLQPRMSSAAPKETLNRSHQMLTLL
ncbi:hypothetical protein [Streptomyces phaeochromogenes]